MGGFYVARIDLIKSVGTEIRQEALECLDDRNIRFARVVVRSAEHGNMASNLKGIYGFLTAP